MNCVGEGGRLTLLGPRGRACFPGKAQQVLEELKEPLLPATLIVFLYRFVCLFMKGRFHTEEEREKAFCPLVCSPSGCNSRGWARPKPELHLGFMHGCRVPCIWRLLLLSQAHYQGGILEVGQPGYEQMMPLWDLHHSLWLYVLCHSNQPPIFSDS